jgi:hypothetical protein
MDSSSSSSSSSSSNSFNQIEDENEEEDEDERQSWVFANRSGRSIIMMRGEIDRYGSAMVNVATDCRFAGIVVSEVETIVTKLHVPETHKPDVKLGARRIRVAYAQPEIRP